MALHDLALVLTVLSLGIWLAALGIGLVVCRHALLPVTRMASAARALNVDDAWERLPAPGTADQLGDLSVSFNCLLDRLQESHEHKNALREMRPIKCALP